MSFISKEQRALLFLLYIDTLYTGFQLSHLPPKYPATCSLQSQAQNLFSKQAKRAFQIVAPRNTLLLPHFGKAFKNSSLL